MPLTLGIPHIAVAMNPVICSKSLNWVINVIVIHVARVMNTISVFELLCLQVFFKYLKDLDKEVWIYVLWESLSLPHTTWRYSTCLIYFVPYFDIYWDVIFESFSSLLLSYVAYHTKLTVRIFGPRYRSNFSYLYHVVVFATKLQSHRDDAWAPPYSILPNWMVITPQHGISNSVYINMRN